MCKACGSHRYKAMIELRADSFNEKTEGRERRRMTCFRIEDLALLRPVADAFMAKRKAEGLLYATSTARNGEMNPPDLPRTSEEEDQPDIHTGWTDDEAPVPAVAAGADDQGADADEEVVHAPPGASEQ